MTSLVQAVLALVAQVSPSQVEGVAERVRGAPGVREPWCDEWPVRTPSARARLDELLDAWSASGASGDFLAGLLVGATHARREVEEEVQVDLVCTGPTTPFVSTRRTDQVLLDLIRGAERELFLVSFVAYDVPRVVDALSEALRRGIEVRFLLESSKSHGGTLATDPTQRMRKALPGAELYSWKDKSEPFAGGRVHAKLAVADGSIAFITSANLTGHALEKNMEVGVIVQGGATPRALLDHLKGLIALGIVGRT